jgi:hypothetical protein
MRGLGLRELPIKLELSTLYGLTGTILLWEAARIFNDLPGLINCNIDGSPKVNLSFGH